MAYYRRMSGKDEELEIWEKLNQDKDIHSWLHHRSFGLTHLEAQGVIIAVIGGMIALLGASIYFILT